MIRAHLLLLGAATLVAMEVGAQSPQSGAPIRGDLATARALCPAMPMAPPPTDSQRVAARALVQRGQQAALLGDRASAREQWRQAARLDPTDVDLAYQLARAHEGAGAFADATTEYCRFLLLAPNAPDAAEARERVAVLSPRSRTIVSEPVLMPPSPGRALALGLLVPGAGQFYAGRPTRGAIALGAATLAVGFALAQRTTQDTVQTTAFDPFGNPYTYTSTRSSSSRPWLAPGLATAAAIAITSAVDAFNYSRRINDDRRLVLDAAPRNNTLLLRVTVR